MSESKNQMESTEAPSVGHVSITQCEALRVGVEQLFPTLVLSKPEVELGDLILRTTPAQIFDLLSTLKTRPEFDFQLLADVTAVDWMDNRPERYEVVYQLLSLSKRWRITVKVSVSEDKPALPTATPLWRGANFLEREIWDMFGITFTGHPDLKRILMYEEFVGHPLRKDYPVQGKQPRVPLRMPEVENTARQMKRAGLTASGLVAIGSRTK